MHCAHPPTSPSQNQTKTTLHQVNAAFGAYKFPVIVVTNKPEPALLFKALALKLEPFLHFVLVSSPSAQFLQRFNNANVPSVHILVPQVGRRTIDSSLSSMYTSMLHHPLLNQCTPNN